MSTITINKNEEKMIINQVILTGHLGKDPVVDTIGNQQKLAKFSIATNQDYTNAKGERVKNTQWHNLIAWGKVAGEIHELLKKGSLVTVEGKINYRNYTDKEGVRRIFTDIVVHQFTAHSKQ
jgi:single-strand DNA-binding protein